MPEEQTEMRRHFQMFLDEKTFEGCTRLEITDEILVTIATQASILLPYRSMYAPWVRVMESEHKNLLGELEHYHITDLDAYGATSVVELFAVITEAFFEKLLQLKPRHPQLYEHLVSFYWQNSLEQIERKINSSFR
jgi:Mlc titration factor MtfA (ptsG expression regulator)